MVVVTYWVFATTYFNWFLTFDLKFLKKKDIFLVFGYDAFLAFSWKKKRYIQIEFTTIPFILLVS